MDRLAEAGSSGRLRPIKAILLPSGDQTGGMPRPASAVATRWAFFPSESASHNSPAGKSVWLSGRRMAAAFSIRRVTHQADDVSRVGQELAAIDAGVIGHPHFAA